MLETPICVFFGVSFQPLPPPPCATAIMSYQKAPRRGLSWVRPIHSHLVRVSRSYQPPASQGTKAPSTKKNLGSLTFHESSWLVNSGILISMVYEIIPKYNWVVFHPLKKPNPPGALFSLLKSPSWSSEQSHRIQWDWD